MSETIAIIDFETTGLSPAKGARVTEVAAVRVIDGSIADSFQSLMNSGEPVPQEIERITGITTQMVQQAPPVAGVLQKLQAFLNGITLVVAHNAKFDDAFLTAEYRRAGMAISAKFACSLKLAQRVYPRSPNYKLATLLGYADIPHSGNFHRALGDATATARLWLQMRRDIHAAHRLDLKHEQLATLAEMPFDQFTRTLADWKK